MKVEVTLPRQSEKQDESLITFWHVSEGDLVKKGDTLVEVQTEKAITEITAPESGIVVEIKKQRSETVAVGEVLAIIETNQNTEIGMKRENIITTKTENEEKIILNESNTKATPRIKKLAKEMGVDWRVVEPTGQNGKLTESDIINFANTIKNRVETNENTEVKSKRHFIATPSVRKFAREHNVNLEDIVPKDASGKITKSDIEDFLAKRELEEEKLKISTEKDKSEKGDLKEKRIPLSGIRKVIAQNMMQSKTTIPHVTHFDEANVKKLIENREAIKTYLQEDGIKITYLPYVVKAFVFVLKKYPYLNAIFDHRNNEIVLKNEYNIGFAVDTERGLVVPVIKDADKKSIVSIAKEIQILAKKAKEGTITADDMSDATCTISNIGSAGGSFFTPIINAPQSSILGIGRIEKKAIVVEDSIEILPMMSLSLSYDHRIIDGVLAQNALNELKRYLSEPAFLLANI